MLSQFSSSQQRAVNDSFSRKSFISFYINRVWQTADVKPVTAFSLVLFWQPSPCCHENKSIVAVQLRKQSCIRAPLLEQSDPMILLFDFFGRLTLNDKNITFFQGSNDNKSRLMPSSKKPQYEMTKIFDKNQVLNIL